MNDTRDGIAKLDFGIANRMPADDQAARRLTAFRPAAKDATEPRELWIFFVRITDDIQCRLGNATHGVHVTQGIGGGNLTVDVRIIDDRREEIDRLHERNLIREAIDTRVVVRGGADEQVRIGDDWQITQNLRYPLRGNLPRSAGTRSVIN